jgi:small subunit ribosomal protein S3
MGHKVHPKVFRIGTIYQWDSKWISQKKYQEFLRQDILIKDFLKKICKEAGIGAIQVERNAKEVTITLLVARPGVIIGRGGAGAEDLRKKVQKQFFAKDKISVKLNIQEVGQPNLSAPIVLQGMIDEIEKRMPFRRVLKQAIEKVRRAGGLGVKVSVAGRLNGAEIARTEKLSSGTIPLQNLRADIDYASGTAHTIYGTIGVKIWIYRGEVFKK